MKTYIKRIKTYKNVLNIYKTNWLKLPDRQAQTGRPRQAGPDRQGLAASRYMVQTDRGQTAGLQAERVDIDRVQTAKISENDRVL